MSTAAELLKKSREEIVKKAAAQATVKRSKKRGVSLPAPWRGKDLTSKQKRLLGFGHQGTGKTYFLLGPLRAGHRIYVVSVDMGGNGVEAVVNGLRPEEEHLLDNITGVDLSSYEQVELFLDSCINGEPPEDLREFGPTFMCLDGFTSFQMDDVGEYVLSHESKEMKDSEMREAALVAGQQDWGGTKRCTLKTLRKFWGLRVDGQLPHKYVTCLENEKISKNDDKVRRGPYVEGGSRDLVGVGAGVVFRCFRQKNKETGQEFCYRFGGDTDRWMVKCRGYQLPEVMAAEPSKVWEVLTGEVPG